MAPIPKEKPKVELAPPPMGDVSTAKREAILTAAAEIFLEQGFGAASMDEVARRAAVSKATIYSHFANKHSLFGAIVNSRCQAMLPAIASAVLGDRPPAEALTLIGRAFLDLLVNCDRLPLYRVVLAEAPRFPELGRAFYEFGPNRVASALADYFRRQNELGVLDIPNPRLAAEQFFGMVLGHNHIRILLGITADPPSPDEREAIVAQAVQIFLKGTARPSA